TAIGHIACLGIEFLFLLSCYLDPNLIARLWKYVKKKCLYAKYYDPFADVRTVIESCLDEASADTKLRSLLSECPVVIRSKYVSSELAADIFVRCYIKKLFNALIKIAEKQNSLFL
ncbi:MAG: hypothetical protein R2880_04305, partial [Deinococcales bacterium]